MRRSLVLAGLAVAAAVAAAVFAALYFGEQPATRTVVAKACGEQRLFGHIRSLTRRGDGFTLRFDPAWFLSGVTANAAAAADGAVAPGQPVPNDNYVVDETHRLYTYLVQPEARVTVLVQNGPLFPGTRVSVAQLAELVAGRSPVKLFESLESGVWIRVHGDTVCSLKQQYRP